MVGGEKMQVEPKASELGLLLDSMLTIYSEHC